MTPVPPGPPARVIVLVVVAAVGVCMLAVASIAPSLLGSLDAWPVFVASFLAVVLALARLWVIQRKRDRHLW